MKSRLEDIKDVDFSLSKCIIYQFTRDIRVIRVIRVSRVIRVIRVISWF